MANFEKKGGKLFIDGKEVLKGWESMDGWFWFATEMVQKQESLIDGKYVKDIIWFGLVQSDQGRALNIASTRTLSSGPRKLVVRISACGLPIINRWGKLGGKGTNFMRGIKEIIQEAESLPVEERAMVIDSLLRSLNPPSMEIDREWVKVARRRLVELRSGAVKPIPGNEVFAKIRERFEK